MIHENYLGALDSKSRQRCALIDLISLNNSGNDENSRDVALIPSYYRSTSSTMTSFIYKATLLLCLKSRLAEARKWQDVVDPSVYLQPNLDVNRHQLKIELDPFFRPEQVPDIAPSPQPISSVWVTRSPSPTDSPSAIPSDAPSLAPTAPTSAPTTREENVEGNGGCKEGTVLYRVNMYDSWGDGWDSATKVTITGIEDQDTTQSAGSTVTKTHTSQQGDTTVTISTTVELTSDHPFGTAPADDGYTYVNPLGEIFAGTLHRGSQGSAYACLVQRRCYEVITRGGDYLDEVSWDIEPVILGSPDEIAQPVVKGGAPSDCFFSIPDENGEYFCEATCSSTLSPQHTAVPDVVSHLTPMDETDDTSSFTISTRSADIYQGKKLGNSLLKALRNGDS